MTIVTRSVEIVPIDSVRPHPDNPRRGDITAIVNRIKHNGFNGAIIAQRSSGRILVGNHRWQAAMKVGLTEIPVMWADVDDNHAKRILLGDNSASDQAKYEEEELLTILSRLNEDDSLDGTGFDTDWLAEQLEKSEEAAPKKPKKKRSSGTPKDSFNVTVFCNNPDAQKNLIELLDGEGYDYSAQGRHSDD